MRISFNVIVFNLIKRAHNSVIIVHRGLGCELAYNYGTRYHLVWSDLTLDSVKPGLSYSEVVVTLSQVSVWMESTGSRDTKAFKRT